MVPLKNRGLTGLIGKVIRLRALPFFLLCRRKLPQGGDAAHPAAHDDHVEPVTSHIYPHFR